MSDQLLDLRGRVDVLATAIRDIEAIAAGCMATEPDEGYEAIAHICKTGGVRAAAGVSVLSQPEDAK